MKKLPLLLFLLLLRIYAHAEGEDLSSYYDSLPLEKRNFDTSQITDYRQDADFDYTTSTVEAPSLLTRITRWLLEKISGTANEKDVSLTLDILMWLILLLAVFLVIRFSLKSDKVQFFGKRNVQTSSVQFMDFQGEESQLDQELEQAEKEANYPLALRLLFIKTLHLLKQAGLIQWRKEKTNGDYLGELRAELQKTPFRRLSLLFEFVHYGGHQMDLADYEEAKNLLADLRKSLKGAKEND